jgi:hypothetical protein
VDRNRSLGHSALVGHDVRSVSQRIPSPVANGDMSRPAAGLSAIQRSGAIAASASPPMPVRKVRRGCRAITRVASWICLPQYTK